MARRRGRHGMKIPIISLAILAGQIFLAKELAGGWNMNTANYFAAQYTGYDFAGRGPRPELLIAGYAPWLAKRFLLPIAWPRLGGVRLPVSLS